MHMSVTCKPVSPHPEHTPALLPSHRHCHTPNRPSLKEGRASYAPSQHVSAPSHMQPGASLQEAKCCQQPHLLPHAQQLATAKAKLLPPPLQINRCKLRHQLLLLAATHCRTQASRGALMSCIPAQRRPAGNSCSRRLSYGQLPSKPAPPQSATNSTKDRQAPAALSICSRVVHPVWLACASCVRCCCCSCVVLWLGSISKQHLLHDHAQHCRKRCDVQGLSDFLAVHHHAVAGHEQAANARSHRVIPASKPGPAAAYCCYHRSCSFPVAVLLSPNNH